MKISARFTKIKSKIDFKNISVRNIVNYLCDPVKNFIFEKLQINELWIPTYTLIKTILILIFSPFIFLVRLGTTTLFLLSRFGKVPTFVTAITGLIFIYATWKTIEWVHDEFTEMKNLE